MNGAFLLVPLLLIRYGLLSMFGKDAIQRAAFFPPLVGREKTAYYFYQASTLAIFVYAFFLYVKTDDIWFPIGSAIFGFGILLCIASVINFAKPSGDGMNISGLYTVSRNPMYVSYFMYYLGCVLLTKSLVLLGLLILFQISSHWIILSEERWCRQKFGEAYVRYTEKVRRYL